MRREKLTNILAGLQVVFCSGQADIFYKGGYLDSQNDAEAPQLTGASPILVNKKIETVRLRCRCRCERRVWGIFR